MTLLALFFLGGNVIHQFAGALLIGIISGTYSSIFNASVLLVLAKRNDAIAGCLGSRSRAAPGNAASPRPTRRTGRAAREHARQRNDAGSRTPERRAVLRNFRHRRGRRKKRR